MMTILVGAIEDRKHINFSYSAKPRTVRPYGLFINQGFWYLVAEELQIIKKFKLIRIEGQPRIVEEASSFIKPAGFDVKNFIDLQNLGNAKTAIIKVRKGTCLNLRNRCEVVLADESWDFLKISYDFDFEIIEKILWYGADIELVEPENLRHQLIARLQETLYE
jgi:proteasome accessory factor B